MNSAAKDYDGTNKYLRITDIDEKSHKFVPKPLTSPQGELDDKFLLKEGDIVFARTGASTGKTYIYDFSDGKLYFAGFLIKFHIVNAYPQFIFYNTLREKYWNWVSIISVRSGQPGINLEEYKKFKLKLPSFSEQEKIANFLLKIDKKIELLEQTLKTFIKLKNKYLVDYSSSIKENNNKLQLNEIFEFKKGIGLSKEKINTHGKYPVVLYGELYTHYKEFINKTKNFTEYNEGLLSEKGDILIPASTTTKGIDLITASVIFQDNVRLGGDINILRNKTKMVNPIYVALILKYGMKKEILRLTQGSTIIHLYGKDLKTIKIPLPSTTIQNNLANLLFYFNKKEEYLNKKVIKLYKYKKGLLQKMFI